MGVESEDRGSFRTCMLHVWVDICLRELVSGKGGGDTKGRLLCCLIVLYIPN